MGLQASAASSRFIVRLLLFSTLSIAPSCSYLPPVSLSSTPRARALRIRSSSRTRRWCSKLQAAPKRLEENAKGMLYVNDKCINCAACSNFAPTVFERNGDIYKHVVFHQPTVDQREELETARAALAACPVNAIRVEINVDGEEGGGRVLKDALSIQLDRPFPQPVYPISTVEREVVDIGVHYLGHHNDATFGAIPYLIMGKSPTGEDISVMVDVPRFSSSAVHAVKSLTESGPDYMLLTHVDDTADHNKWKNQFPAMKRIFHSGDLGRHNWVGDLTLEDVEILLQKEDKSAVEILLQQEDKGVSEDELTVWNIDGNQQPTNALEQISEEEFLVVHTPGHSPGSICLLFRPKSLSPEFRDTKLLLAADGKKVKYPSGVLFTGDTYAWTTRDGGHMSGFPNYGNNLLVQAASLEKLGKLSSMWDIIAPGHGHVRSYLEHGDSGSVDRDVIKLDEMNDALEELRSHRR